MKPAREPAASRPKPCVCACFFADLFVIGTLKVATGVAGRAYVSMSSFCDRTSIYSIYLLPTIISSSLCYTDSSTVFSMSLCNS